MSSRITILTNCVALTRSAAKAPFESCRVVELGAFRADVGAAIRGAVDVVLVDGDPGTLLRWCMARMLVPRPKFSIVSLDFLPKKPGSVRERLRLPMLRLLLRQVERFLVYQKDVTGFCAVLSVPASRVRYVPFKVNHLEALRRMRPSDNGVFLSCGRSYRDYATLCEAFRALPFECHILAQWSEVEQHGTRFDGIDVPVNVKLITDDGTADSWNRIIGESRAVILPIDPETLFPAGIGTYLVAMALGKCVITTEGPGTIGMLDDDTAVVVPPRDAAALREAIRRVAEDGTYRERIARGGQAYALALGGEERLARDVVAELMALPAAGVKRPRKPA